MLPIAKNRAYAPGNLRSLFLLSGSVLYGNNTGDSYYDYVFIRKYSGPEPSVLVQGKQVCYPMSPAIALFWRG